MKKRNVKPPLSRYALRSRQLSANNSTTNIPQSSTIASRTMTSPSEIEPTRTASLASYQALEHPGSEPPKCFLLSIAAELRNEIYELAFTCNDTEVNLSTTKPPSSALLQTCRQINNEARQLLIEASRDYYDNRNFCLILHRKPGPLNPYRLLEEVAKTHNLQRIKKLHVRLISAKGTDGLFLLGGVMGEGGVIDATLQQDRLSWDVKLSGPLRPGRNGHKCLVPYRGDGFERGFFYLRSPCPLTLFEPKKDAMPTHFAPRLPLTFCRNVLVNTKDQIEALIGGIMSSYCIEKQRKLQREREFVDVKDTTWRRGV